MPQYNDYTKIPMGKNDIGAKTIGEYFEKLLLTLWDEQEDFSGKRPFGNSGWEYDVYASLISAGVVDGNLDEEGYVVDVTYSAANDIVCQMIKQIFARDADVVPKSEDVISIPISALTKLTPMKNDVWADFIKNAKTEVAREIFEEIEEARIRFMRGKIDENQLVVRLYMLKKKYTEGGNGT